MDDGIDDHDRQVSRQESRAALWMLAAVALTGGALWTVFDSPAPPAPTAPAVEALDDAARIAIVERRRAAFGPDLPPVPAPRPAAAAPAPAPAAAPGGSAMARILSETDDVGRAMIFCRIIDRADILTQPCRVSGYDIELVVFTTPPEARKMCDGFRSMMIRNGFYFEPGWTLRIYSPFSGDRTIARCRL